MDFNYDSVAKAAHQDRNEYNVKPSTVLVKNVEPVYCDPFKFGLHLPADRDTSQP